MREIGSTILFAGLAFLLLPPGMPGNPGGERVEEDRVAARVILDLAVEGLFGRWDARRSLSGRIRHLDRKGNETTPYRSEVMNRQHNAIITIDPAGTYVWRAETGEVLRGRWVRTDRPDAPVILRRGERGNDWTIIAKGRDGAGVPIAEITETTGTLRYSARKADDLTSGVMTRRPGPRAR